MELQTTSILSLFQTTKEERQSFVLDLISRLQNSEADPMKVHLQVKCMEELIGLIKSNSIYSDILLDAAAKHEKSFQYYNSKFETKEAGVKYDFSKCGDPVYQMLEQRSESAASDLKEREAFLKTIPLEGLLVTDEQTGETYKIFPPTKTSTTTVAVTLK